LFQVRGGEEHRVVTNKVVSGKGRGRKTFFSGGCLAGSQGKSEVEGWLGYGTAIVDGTS
jgi:hypothetical protein